MILISSFHASLLTSLFDERYNNFPPELRTQASLLISSLFCNNISLVSLFEHAGLIYLVYPLFPHFRIPSFLHFYAERSFECSKFLIENDFVSRLIKLLSLHNSDSESNENEENFLDYILCAGSICDFSQYKDQLLPLSPVLTSIILNDADWKIQCEAINSLSILLKNVQIAAKDFLSNGSLIEMISLSKCESNINYLTSIINLLGSLLNHQDLLNEELLDKILSLFASTLSKFKDECYKSGSYETCISLVANTVSDGCFENDSDFAIQCLKYGIVHLLFEIFNGDNSWNLKINVFDAILTLFSNCYKNAESFNTFIELGIIDSISENISEMQPCIAIAITSALNAIIMFLNENGSDENQSLTCFLLSEEIIDSIDEFLESEDPDVRYNAEKVNSFIHSMLDDQYK